MVFTNLLTLESRRALVCLDTNPKIYAVTEIVAVNGFRYSIFKTQVVQKEENQLA